jgi:hypothetical protein
MSSTVSLEEQEKLRAQEKRVVRKVDWILMPILTVTLGLQVSSSRAYYSTALILQYYDKAVLGNAAVFGILKDLDLIRTVHGVSSTKRYSTATAAVSMRGGKLDFLLTSVLLGVHRRSFTHGSPLRSSASR